MFEYINGQVIGANSKDDFGRFLRLHRIILSRDSYFILDLRNKDPKRQVALAYEIGNTWKECYSNPTRSLEIKVRATKKYKTHFLGGGVMIHYC